MYSLFLDIPWLVFRFGRRVFTPGETAQFNCIPPGIDIARVQWLVNGSRLESLSLPNMTTQFRDPPGLGFLEIRSLPLAYNGTVLQCQGFSSTNSVAGTSNILTISVEGKAVRNSSA